jgi:hypothetical protein
MALNDRITKALTQVGIRTDETYQVAGSIQDDEGTYTVNYSDGSPALILYVEFSGHGEYSWEVPGDVDWTADLDWLYDLDGVELADAIRAEVEE